MFEVLKKGLIIGCIQIFAYMVFTIITQVACCPVCPLVMCVVSSLVAGWLTVEWVNTTPERALLDGAIVGALTGMGCLIGMTLSNLGYFLLSRVPGFENLLIIESPTGDFALTGFFLILMFIGGSLILGGVLLVLMTAITAITARYHALTKAYHRNSQLLTESQ